MFLETGGALGSRYVGIPMEDGGMIPEELDSIMPNWDSLARGAPKRKVLYAILMRQNPTDCALSKARPEAICNVCYKHNILTLEHDPYQFIHMHSLNHDSGDENVTRPIRRFLLLDTEGRACAWIRSSNSWSQTHG
jgi:aromatic amino acid aminotransferase I / 2-aminoadipate transaminase